MSNSLKFLAIPILFATSTHVFAALGDGVIEKRVEDSTIRVETSARFGGAVSSLIFRGVQYVDTWDHGRELQSAASFDRLGECFNPTEAGSSADKKLSTTSTKVIAAEVGSDWIATKADMAFWLPPGYNYKRKCGDGDYPAVTRAVNTHIRGGYILDKRISIGTPVVPNVVVDRVTYVVPEAHRFGTFEAATVYTPVNFSKRYVFNPDTGDISPTNFFGEQSQPVILATEDGSSAIGVFSEKLPQDKRGYGTFTYSNTQKINCVFREKDISAGQKFSYKCTFAVGTLNEVKDSIARLHRHATDNAR
ncbi:MULTISPECIES: hypothetical protein [Burkholderia]|uniref:hypothetical protein n=1 Tax=Burkholderia TaxID=32008 RepID=UPI000F6031DD|nr:MULTISPECIES: hypothetical protein [Burkholderia]